MTRSIDSVEVALDVNPYETLFMNKTYLEMTAFGGKWRILILYNVNKCVYSLIECSSRLLTFLNVYNSVHVNVRSNCNIQRKQKIIVFYNRNLMVRIALTYLLKDSCLATSEKVYFHIFLHHKTWHPWWQKCTCIFPFKYIL